VLTADDRSKQLGSCLLDELLLLVSSLMMVVRFCSVELIAELGLFRCGLQFLCMLGNGGSFHYPVCNMGMWLFDAYIGGWDGAMLVASYVLIW
jgi:hypothetical protein